MVAGACVAGGIFWSGDATPPAADNDVPYTGGVRLVAYDSCADVEADLKRAAKKKVTAWGLDDVRILDSGPMPAPAAGDAKAERAAAAPAQHSGTNNHEADADEPDLVKTDGARIVTVADGTLRVVDTATRALTASLELPGGQATALLLDRDRALVAVPKFEAVDRDSPSGNDMTTSLVLVDLAGGGARVAGTLTVDGSYLDGRQVGSVARIVSRSQPRLRFPVPADPTAALERNREIIEEAPLEQWLPRATLDANGHREVKQLDCRAMSRPSGYTGTAALTVYTIDLRADLGTGDAVSIAADGDTVYGTATSLYIADDQWSRTGNMPTPRGRTADVHTDIHQFDISAPGTPVYLASGTVDGSLVNQYALSEHRGNLRVATTAGQASSVTVLTRRDRGFTRTGHIGGLGVGEAIQSVRYLGDTAYVVTFRRTDPLYTLDLADPAHPRVTGELKITGYSAYLHPLDDGRLLGVGQEATTQGRATGTQVSLFDTTSAPARRIAQHHLPGASSEAEFDPHAFLYWADRDLIAIPVDTARGSGAVLVLRLVGDQLTELATLRHPEPSRVDSRIRRTLVAGDALWTVSAAGLQAVNLETANQLAWVPFG
ncbi:Beta propeller domain-containing protein [Actinokineospora diospyrosa]|uniref:Beta propeller domain-containing protein n=1 Tax=Actinokineospora diospyrosa TaxID=103728 RepID=A0ABT1I6Q6_9PSEU|nr:Beta propeller domain-containing protein [Actinokineospora diospyrosa]